MRKNPKERDCTCNSGIICTRSDCDNRCAWNPKELERRKQIINDGSGLQVGANGLKRLIIKREEHSKNAD